MPTNDFNLFTRALNDLKESEHKIDQKSSANNTTDDSSEIKCEHKNIVMDCGASVCIDCGKEVSRDISREKEWRYYGQSDTRHSSDPNRVQARKSEERSIYKDVETLGFSDPVIAMADSIYTDVTRGQIFRGMSRKAIIFASIFHSLKKMGKPVSHEKLTGIFNLTRKAGLKGLKHVNLHAPKNCGIRTTYITSENIAEEIMDKFAASREQKDSVIKICQRIKNRSSKLNRSRPKSVACAVVYYWVRRENMDFTLKKFAEIVVLSELTINKIAREIATILGDDDVDL